MQDIVDTKLTLVSNATPNGQPNRFKNRLTFPLDATNAELALVSASLPVTYDAHEGGYLGKPVRIALIRDPASLCMTELKAYVAKTPSCPWTLLADNCFITHANNRKLWHLPHTRRLPLRYLRLRKQRTGCPSQRHFQSLALRDHSQHWPPQVCAIAPRTRQQ